MGTGDLRIDVDFQHAVLVDARGADLLLLRGRDITPQSERERNQ
jgi:hypothetical protein